MVPLKALHETRDELKALKAQLEAIQQPQTPQAEQVPDIFEDPEGFVRPPERFSFTRPLSTRPSTSRKRWRGTRLGKKPSTRRRRGARRHLPRTPPLPALRFAAKSLRLPCRAIPQSGRAVAKLGNDPAEIEAFLAWKQSQQGAPHRRKPLRNPTPPPSIASAPSAGAMQHIATGRGAAFDNVIK
jgi:hypothetical protein